MRATRGRGSTRRLPSGRWQARRASGGVRQSRTFDAEADAQIWLDGGIRGSIPGQRAVTLREHELRDELARHLGGLTEIALPFGRADVADSVYVIEVEPVTQWRHAVRQALAYAAQCERKPGIALFGSADWSQVHQIGDHLRRCPTTVALWWYATDRQRPAWTRVLPLEGAS